MNKYGQLLCDSCFKDGQTLLVHVTVEGDYGQDDGSGLSRDPADEEQWCLPCLFAAHSAQASA
jgi:hypothetical protein